MMRRDEFVRPPDCRAERWELRLFVAGRTPKSAVAFANLSKICEERLGGQYIVEVVDLIEHPEMARTEQIMAVAALASRLPEPMWKIIGDLSGVEGTLVGLRLRMIGPRA